MNYYEIRDRVPCSEIDALTVDAARVWLERNGWTLDDEGQTAFDGLEVTYWHGEPARFIHVLTHARPGKSRRRMVRLINEGVRSTGKRAHVVIAEIRAIAEWQRRRKEWVEPKGETCSWCLACERELADVWETPGGLNPPFTPTCPTCFQRGCPRATDHRNECSGSNEAGQEGSRFA